ncbi:alanine racemase [Chlamydiota bacterium]
MQTLHLDVQTKGLIKTWVEIDKSAILHNLRVLRNKLPSGTKILSVIKDDAYGLGLEHIAEAVIDGKTDWVGVANIIEAKIVRRRYPKIPILILGPSYIDGIRELVSNDITPVVASYDYMEKLNREAQKENRRINVHIMIDTGMGRIGIWYQKSFEFFTKLIELKNLNIQGICSHFCSADDQDQRFSQVQLQRFKDFCLELELMGIHAPIKHIANSSAVINFPEAHIGMVRVGLFNYGIYASNFVERIGLRPAISMKTRVAFIKDVEPGRTISYNSTYTCPLKTRLATISIGYSHGLNRRLSNKGNVLIRGVRAPIVGAITMDQTVVDVGHIPGVTIDDEVVLIGRQYNKEITIEEQALKAEVIPYEIVCSMNRSLPRIYVNNESKIYK